MSLQNPLTYPDLAGRRKIRRYALSALLILFSMVSVFIFALARQQQAQVELVATPRPVAQILPALSPTPTPIPTASPTPEPCPTDPAKWGFQDVFPGDHYKRLEPACVLDGLAQTVAWHMLERLGYPKPEAAQLLGFSTIPWQPTQTVTGLTNTQGPLSLALRMEWAPHPAYRYWTVDAEGAPGLTYSLRGCYRTRDILGNQTEAWDPRPVHCLVAIDYTPGWAVNQLGTQVYSADWREQTPTRALLLFGYTGAGWVFLGELQDQHLTLDDATILPGEQAVTAARYGVQVWDAVWLEKTFGLEMHPLPQDWQTSTDTSAIQTIADALNAFEWQPPQ